MKLQTFTINVPVISWYVDKCYHCSLDINDRTFVSCLQCMANEARGIDNKRHLLKNKPLKDLQFKRICRDCHVSCVSWKKQICENCKRMRTNKRRRDIYRRKQYTRNQVVR